MIVEPSALGAFHREARGALRSMTKGHRLDVVEFHPAYHRLMAMGRPASRALRHAVSALLAEGVDGRRVDERSSARAPGG